jgi:Zn-dependent M28 family amino/carboxypeptidase
MSICKRADLCRLGAWRPALGPGTWIYLNIFLLILLSASCAAPKPAAKAKRIIRELSSDEMQGRRIFTPGIDKAAAFIEHEFRSIGLVPLKDEQTLRMNFSLPEDERKLFNVVGVIPGRSKPEEIVIFSAHYDHLGIVRPIAGDSIANGADDNASGVTAVISLARYFRQLNNNERTLVFAAFTAEERGGFGSRHFSQKLNPDHIVAMFNIEMIGKPSKFGKNTAFITGYEMSDFGDILQRNLEGTAFKFHPDPYPEQKLFYRSDNAALAALGVPAHTISTDQIDKDKFYHTVGDELKTLNINNIKATIKAIALSARSIIAGTDTPKRIPKLTR